MEECLSAFVVPTCGGMYVLLYATYMHIRPGMGQSLSRSQVTYFETVSISDRDGNATSSAHMTPLRQCRAAWCASITHIFGVGPVQVRFAGGVAG